jgi:hypothetical protein
MENAALFASAMRGHLRHFIALGCLVALAATNRLLRPPQQWG